MALMIRFNLQWQADGIRIENAGEKGSGTSGQVKKAHFWERKYCVIDQVGTLHWLNRGSLIDRINKSPRYTGQELDKGYSWDYLGWFDRETDKKVHDKLIEILKLETNGLQQVGERCLRQKTPKDCFSFIGDDLLAKILSHIGIKELGTMSQLSLNWSTRVWRLLGEQWEVPLSCSQKDDSCIKKIQMRAAYCFEDHPFLKEEVARITKSRKVVDLKQLFQLCEARDRILLSHAIPEDIFYIDLRWIQSLSELLAQSKICSDWCKMHQTELEQVKAVIGCFGPMTSLPSEIGLFAQLQELALGGGPAGMGRAVYHRLTYLSSELWKLGELRTLSLSNNLLTSLPSEIGKLTKLEWLNLKNNQLTAIPVQFKHLTRLKHLDLSINQLTTLPTFGKFFHLKELNLEENQLTALPPGFGSLTQLQKLNLKGNRLTVLSPEFGKLLHLQELDLRDNELTVAPLGLENLSQLKWVLLDSNPLIDTPSKIGDLFRARCRCVCYLPEENV